MDIITSLYPCPHPHPPHRIPFSVLFPFSFISLCGRYERSPPLLPVFRFPSSPLPLSSFLLPTYPSPPSLSLTVPSPSSFPTHSLYPFRTIPNTGISLRSFPPAFLSFSFPFFVANLQVGVRCDVIMRRLDQRDSSFKCPLVPLKYFCSSGHFSKISLNMNSLLVGPQSLSSKFSSNSCQVRALLPFCFFAGFLCRFLACPPCRRLRGCSRSFFRHFLRPEPSPWQYLALIHLFS